MKFYAVILLGLVASSPAMAQTSMATSNQFLDSNTPMAQAPPSESPSGSRIARRVPKAQPPKPADSAGAASVPPNPPANSAATPPNP
jgi:hypothetical protein